jgi:hypothetical protein
MRRQLAAVIAGTMATVALLQAPASRAETPAQPQTARVTIAQFDLSFFACSQGSCNSFLVARADADSGSLRAGSMILIRVSTSSADARLDPAAIVRNPSWQVELLRETSCDHALKDFPPALSHPADGTPCVEGSQFSSVGATVAIRVPDDRRLQCFRLTRLVSQ